MTLFEVGIFSLGLVFVLCQCINTCIKFVYIAEDMNRIEEEKKRDEELKAFAKHMYN